ncbi:hypothetical protein CEXT_476991 [Caerostris extrusa]|uniref:Uncharacterized protein n=1 Tax=Caerostris extrusa TaxID=172846 RepID=A0AAV4UA15_CAEEX|nr:hypothetical protein CEXT_476991 [Caerostris extrusa]
MAGEITKLPQIQFSENQSFSTWILTATVTSCHAPGGTKTLCKRPIIYFSNPLPINNPAPKLPASKYHEGGGVDCESEMTFGQFTLNGIDQPINNELDTTHECHERTFRTTPVSDLRLIGGPKTVAKQTKIKIREALLRVEVNLILAGMKN